MTSMSYEINLSKLISVFEGPPLRGPALINYSSQEFMYTS